MSIRLKRHAATLAVVLLIGTSLLPAQEPQQLAPTSRFVAFPTFRPKFRNDSERT